MAAVSVSRAQVVGTNHACTALHLGLWGSYLALVDGGQTVTPAVTFPLGAPYLPASTESTGGVSAWDAIRTFVEAAAFGEQSIFCREACTALTDVTGDGINWETECP